MAEMKWTHLRVRLQSLMAGMWGTREHRDLVALFTLARDRWRGGRPYAQVSHNNTAVTRHFPITLLRSVEVPGRGHRPFGLCLASIKEARLLTCLACPPAKAELKPTSSLITLRLNCSVTQGRV